MIEHAGSEQSFRVHTLAWALLEHSYRIEPQLPAGLRWRSNPRIRLWDDAMGWGGGDYQPTTLTVYELWTPETGYRRLVRKAVWDREADLRGPLQSQRHVQPVVKVRDADVPDKPFREVLAELSGHQIAAINLQDDGAAADDVSSFGFEYFSRDQPSATIRLEWSCHFPADWAPVIQTVEKIKKLLLGCLSDSQEGR